MSLTYTTTIILCAATDVGMHGLLAIVNRVTILCYPLVCVHCGPVVDFFITKQTSLHPFDFVRNLFHLLYEIHCEHIEHSVMLVILGGYVFVPEKLVQELAELRIAFAKFLCDYEEQFRHSPTIQVKFIKMMLQLFRKLLKSEDHSFQSLFRTLIEEKVSLFNTYYLKTFFTIFPDDIR